MPRNATARWISNVNQLKVSWAFQTGVIDAALRSTPLVADVVRYVTSNNNHVFTEASVLGDLPGAGIRMRLIGAWRGASTVTTLLPRRRRLFAGGSCL